VLTGSEGNVVFPLAAIVGAGWLFLFVVLLIAPPSPGPHEGGGQGEGRTPDRPRSSASTARYISRPRPRWPGCCPWWRDGSASWPGDYL